MEKTFILIFNVVRNDGSILRTDVKEVIARTNVEAIMKYFDNCPYPQHFVLVSCAEKIF